MTKTDISIYRGLKEKFDPAVHVGFFITSDTGELLIGDQSLGQTISGWEINNGVLTLQLNTGKDINITFPEATETVKGLLSAADKAQLVALQANLDSKVDKVTGKSLVLDSEIEKLAGLPNSTELTNSIATAKASGDNAQSDLNAHKQNKSNPHEVTKAQVGLGNVTNDAQVKRSEMGVANGVATLDVDGKVPASQLPSYVDDIVDVYATYTKSGTGVLSNITLYSDAAKTKLVTGEAGKIYQNVTAGEPNYQFRWTGTIFSQTGASSLIIGEVAGTAYDGAKGKANTDNIAKIKETSLSHIKDDAPITTTADKVSVNYECFEGEQYGASGTAHTADIPAATTTKAGVMSAADKVKLEKVNTDLVVADEEDVTAVDGKIKLKDRDTTNGMGYKILRLPANGILTQDMINKPNTIYEIRYDFDLNGETITIPENCTLKFEGGKFSNGTITPSNTIINSPSVKIFNQISVTKTFSGTGYAEWFGAYGDGITDDTNSIKSALTYFDLVEFLSSKIYKVSQPIKLRSYQEVRGQHSTRIVYNGNANDALFTLDYGVSIRNMIIEMPQLSTAIRLSSEFIGSDYTDQSKYSADIHITVENLIIRCDQYDKQDVKVNCIECLSNGKGQSFWQVLFKNISIFGPFQYAIYLNNGTVAGAAKNTWQTDVKFEFIKINRAVNGIYVGKDDIVTISGGYPPERITFSSVSMQSYENFTERFASIMAGNRILFTHCEPWDWKAVSMPKPFLINPNNIQGLVVENCANLGKNNIIETVEPIKMGNISPYTITSMTDSPIMGSFDLEFIFGSDYISNHTMTVQEAVNLPSGIYNVPLDSKYATFLGLSTNTNSELFIGLGWSASFLEVLHGRNGVTLLKVFSGYTTSQGDLQRSLATSAYTIIKMTLENINTPISGWVVNDRKSLAWKVIR